MAIDFTAFNEAFFAKSELGIHWFNRKGMIKLDDKRIVEISVASNKNETEYVGYEVAVLHKEQGILSKNLFEFNVFLKQVEGIKRPLNTCFNIKEQWCASGYAHWYVATPSIEDRQKMAESIGSYISYYV